LKTLSNYKNIVIIILSISIVLLGFQITSQRKDIEEYEDLKYQQDTLLFGENRVAGFTCGALNMLKAEEILNTDRVISNYSQGPTDRIGLDNKITDNLYWSDSCRYIDELDSSKYVELYIDTFQTEFEAKKYFSDFIPVVNENKELSNENFGEKLIYDSGVYYLLRDNQIVQISTGYSEEISKNIFIDILSILED
jgi:hypothetical protein